MQASPFEHVRQGPLGEVAIHTARRQLDRDLEITIDGVKVRWGVITVVHGDDNPKEPTDLGHEEV